MRRAFMPKACHFQFCQLLSIPSASKPPSLCVLETSTASATLMLYGVLRGCFSSPMPSLFPACEQLPGPMPRLGAALLPPEGGNWQQSKGRGWTWEQCCRRLLCLSKAPHSLPVPDPTPVPSDRWEAGSEQGCMPVARQEPQRAL